MLRVSASTTDTDIDLNAINGDTDSAAVGITYGPELVRFAQSFALRDDELAQHRQALLDIAGPDVLVDAAGVAANFQRMTRIADSIGIPVDDMQADVGQAVRQELNLTRFASAQNTLNQQA
ncbi:MAG: hypothetical protein NXH95_20545 [Pseudomonadaceae bacterium]|nr:hypothetical protein [Pseudomonadaceae bacterium]